MKIEIMIKNVYGKQTIYPVCKNAKIFAALKGQKTLTETDINLIKQLGYEIQVKQEQVTL